MKILFLFLFLLQGEPKDSVVVDTTSQTSFDADTIYLQQLTAKFEAMQMKQDSLLMSIDRKIKGGGK